MSIPDTRAVLAELQKIARAEPTLARRDPDAVPIEGWIEAFCDEEIAKGTAPAEYWGWLQFAAARRIAKRKGGRKPDYINRACNRTMGHLARKFIARGLKPPEVYRTLARVTGLTYRHTSRICKA